MKCLPGALAALLVLPGAFGSPVSEELRTNAVLLKAAGIKPN
jgi:hypothetical protein